jgi:hypothetical protein
VHACLRLQYEADVKSGQALGGGKTALHYAAQHNRLEVRYTYPPFFIHMSAIRFSTSKLISILPNMGTYIFQNVVDRRCTLQVVQALLEAGADVTIRDDNTFDEENGTGSSPMRPADYSKRGTPIRTLLVRSRVSPVCCVCVCVCV